MSPKTPLLFAFILGLSAVFASEPGHAGNHSRNSALGLGRPLPPGWEPAVHDSMIRSFTLLERAEFQTGDETDNALLEAQGWIGGDYHRFWWKLEGEQQTAAAKAGEFEAQALYSRLFRPFWDYQAGIRIDRQYSGTHRDTLGFLTVGLEGIAPFWFDLEPALFLSEKGKVSFRLTVVYDQLITQRLVLQPRFNLNAAFQDDPRRDVAAGVNDVEYGLRLRYDIKRWFSPYVGVTWRRVLGQTRHLARQSGENISATSVIIGLRTWF